jgi:hypothetical protein
MPSSTVKQAKVMSAIAHGWHPDKGSVAKIPVKVAKEFHAADKGHKYGKGHHEKVHAALSTARKYNKKADGGDVTDDDQSVGPKGDKLPIGPDWSKLNSPTSQITIPDVGSPLVPSGPTWSGTQVGNKAADIGSRAAYGAMTNIADLATTPGNIASPNPYSPGSEEADWYDSQRDRAMGNWAPNMALSMVGGSGAVPATANELRTGIGIYARGNHVDTLPVFKQLESQGANPTENFMKTGWYRGDDKLPRFWIDDSAARLKTENMPSSNGQVLLPGPTRLGNIWDHPELYKAYPGLRNMEVNPLPTSSPKNMAGAYNPEDGKLYLNSKMDPDTMHDAIHHEVVHAVQHYEGFSNGGNSQQFLSPWTSFLPSAQAAAKDRYLHLAGESEARDATYLRNNPSARFDWQIPMHVNPELNRTNLEVTRPLPLTNNFKRGGFIKLADGGDIDDDDQPVGPKGDKLPVGPDWSKYNQPMGELKPASYTPTQQAGNMMQDALIGAGADPYTARHLTEGVGNIIKATPLGVPGAAADYAYAKSQGDTAGQVKAALGFIPGVGPEAKTAVKGFTKAGAEIADQIHNVVLGASAIPQELHPAANVLAKDLKSFYPKDIA